MEENIVNLKQYKEKKELEESIARLIKLWNEQINDVMWRDSDED